MDWYSWLSRSNLSEPLVDDYSVLFSHNQLEKDDVQHFDHEFLQSMGISIAKHRLEILKLAKKERRRLPLSRPVTGLLAALRVTKKCLSKYIGTSFSRCESSSAVMVVPEASHGRRWRGSALKKSSKGVMVLKQHGMLMITNSGEGVAGPPAVASRSASPMLCDGRRIKYEDGGGEIRWDSLFQDLRPT